MQKGNSDVVHIFRITGSLLTFSITWHNKRWERYHFPKCEQIPDDVLDEIESLKGSKADRDFEQKHYWIDALGDLGVAVTKEGLFFERDPSEPSPATIMSNPSASLESSPDDIISLEEKGLIPDSIYFMMKQGRTCSLNKEDQSKGISDRRLNFPGICCKHCLGEDESQFVGRYFPHTKKMITETFPHSFYVHILACSKCPQNIKNSLRYLEYRASVQEKQLDRVWKKRYYAKSLWKKLHESYESRGPKRRLSFSKNTTVEGFDVQDDEESATNSSEDETKPNVDFIQIAARWLINWEEKEDKKIDNAGVGVKRKNRTE